MHIAQLHIKGFRGIKEGIVNLTPHCVLVGSSNAGKTTIIDALRYLLERDRLFRQFSEYDFFGGDPKPEDRIFLKAVITGFETNDEADYPDCFNMDGATPYWWNPVTQTLVSIREEDSFLAMQIALSARFDHEDLEVEVVRYFYSGEGDPFEEINTETLSNTTRRSMGFFFLPANRTWEKTLSFGSDLFRRVLHFQEAMPSDDIKSLKNWLKAPDIKLEDSVELHPIIKRVNLELNAFFGRKEANVKFLPSYGDIEGVLEILFPYLPGKSECLLPIGKHGSGIVSLQTLLLLLEFGRARKVENENFILAAEEPELHLHPGHHRRLVSRIKGVSDQSIITTHSPEIAAYHKAHEILFVHNENGTLRCEPLIPQHEEIPDKNALLRLYTIFRAVLCEALMHEIVLIPEGQTEYNWLRALTSASITSEGFSLDDTNSTPVFGIVPTQSAHVSSTFQRFSALHEGLVPIVDGDSGGDQYVGDLIKLSQPPAVIVQLAKNQTIEDIIAWIIAGESDLISEVAIILNDTQITTQEAIANLLKGGLKTRWDLHEQLISLISSYPNSISRARVFLQGIQTVMEGESPISGQWEAGSHSQNGTQIWHFNVANLFQPT